MKKLAVVALAVALGACRPTPPPKPPTPPTPTPPPATTDARPDHVVFPELLLRTHEGRFVLTDAHRPFVMKGVIFCWSPDEPDGTPAKVTKSIAEGKTFPYMWTLISPELMAYAKRAGGANTFIIRLGPYREDKLCCGLQEVGPPLLADGSFNPKFDAYVLKIAWEAGRMGALLGVSLDDFGWGGKHQCGGDDVGYALPACEPAIGPERKRFIEHFVTLLDPFANVFFEIGNENALHMNWTPDFERANYALIRAAEKMVAHVVVSNTSDFDGPYEAMASHKRSAVDSPVNGKPVMVNEYNPAMSPGEFAQCFEEMKAVGGACFYWRSDGSDELMEASLPLMKGGPVSHSKPSAGVEPPRNKASIRKEFTRGSWDLTPAVNDHEYCVKIGMGFMADGTPRGWCPIRNECGETGAPVPGDPQSYECNLRALWEVWLLQAPHPICESDGRVNYIDSGFRVTSDGSWLECHDATGSITTGRFEP